MAKQNGTFGPKGRMVCPYDRSKKCRENDCATCPTNPKNQQMGDETPNE